MTTGMTREAQILTEDEFTSQVVSQYTDVIGEKVGGSIISFSDEWFARAENLIKPKAPIRDATRFTFAGAWYDGWETRRHNTEEADWVIFKFGVSSAKLIGCEVDTAFFNGNHAPAISVEAVKLDTDNVQDWSEVPWEQVVEKIECGPSQRHFFKNTALTKGEYTHARLKMYPDGGIARFRLYGEVVPNLSTITAQSLVDFASVGYGGLAVSWSDQHFGTVDNLLLPGRGVDMSDGWETKRSRTPGHVDWVIIKLGSKTSIKEIVVDTAHFRGNFPQKITLHGLSTEEKIPSNDNSNWIPLVEPTKTEADKQHFFKEFVNPGDYTHVRLTIIPDGGVKRVRVFGTLA
ncbi:allantoicase [Cyberlindnera jadinii NRRL Y-1542]|uniref:allantoicase n=1 Tax=Cyberlindnera jadinii (strain ATCC 18201 / CBS 1600 / BCRC 20928 / JCM 3617 / NBRC 0987 / NRRL Y-1542) TaxID=983966 RepID=A0A1E4S9G6_CYBJN|nr:allantoicase [Cyberlindnera jadinii NRRL Y-1542]ODV76118.1 allantoicase [Cyberlindnera jadinii NRRL Y-1542]